MSFSVRAGQFFRKPCLIALMNLIVVELKLLHEESLLVLF